MSLASIQAKLNAKYSKLSNLGTVGIKISPALSKEDQVYRAYVYTSNTPYLKAKANGRCSRHKFPGKGDNF